MAEPTPKENKYSNPVTSLLAYFNGVMKDPFAMPTYVAQRMPIFTSFCFSNTDDEDEEWRAECRAEAIDALREGESVSKPPISGLFEDVYKDMPWNISRQLDETLAHAKRFPEEVPHGVPLH